MYHVCCKRIEAVVLESICLCRQSKHSVLLGFLDPCGDKTRNPCAESCELTIAVLGLGLRLCCYCYCCCCCCCCCWCCCRRRRCYCCCCCCCCCYITRLGATRGVTVSTSAFLACHKCYCAGSSLAWGLNLRALICGIF